MSRYTVTSYVRFNETEDLVTRVKSGLTARAAAKLAVKWARTSKTDAGTAIRRDDDQRHRVGSYSQSGRYAGDVQMVCLAENPYYRGRPKKPSIVKCQVKQPAFKTALKMKSKRRR